MTLHFFKTIFWICSVQNTNSWTESLPVFWREKNRINFTSLGVRCFQDERDPWSYLVFLAGKRFSCALLGQGFVHEVTEILHPLSCIFSMLTTELINNAFLLSAFFFCFLNTWWRISFHQICSAHTSFCL